VISCEACGGEVERIPEVGDVWLDAGIVPFSTLGWQNPEWIPGGHATGAAKGLSTADLPDHSYWEEWFPADWVSEMREQIRLWFYSQLFMSVALVGRAPFKSVLGYEKMLDEKGREMHGSWGNMIEAEEAFERMGADVMRWQFAAQPPDRNLLFGFGTAHETKRKLLTLWHSAKFLVDYGNVDDFTPRFADLDGGPDADLRPLDRWLVARTNKLVADATEALEAQLTYRLIAAFEAFVDDLSNWYIRRSRRRFWDGDEVALRTLWYAIAQSLRVVSPVMPFLTDHLWRNLAGPAEGAPASIHLAPWPEPGEVDEGLLADVAAVRRVVELGRQARSASGIKHRQPLRKLIVQGVDLRDGHVDEIADELRVKEVVFGEVEATELRVKPNLPTLGPKLGKELGAVRAALQAGEFEELGEGRFRAAGHELGPDEVLVERHGLEGWAVAADDGLTVALDTSVDAELELEGRGFDLIHRLNSMRKDAGFELTDRVKVVLPRDFSDLVEQHGDWIAREVLAVSIGLGDVDEPQLERT
jgi:isoleucyl-tRNA synthetase